MADSNYFNVGIASFKAGGTISANRAVILDSTEGQVVAASAITDVVIGFALQDATSGETVPVQLYGKAKVTASAAISLGAQLMPTASGSGKVSTASGATAKSCGIALQAAAADGEVIEALLCSINVNGPANS